MRKKILCLLLTIVLSLSVFTGCSLFTYDNERDNKQVVATIDSVVIEQVSGAEKLTFKTEKKKIYKYELINAINTTGASLINSGYYSDLEEVIEILLNQMVARELVLNEADAQLSFGNITWGQAEENEVKKGIYTSIDNELASFRREILIEHGEAAADTEGTQADSAESTETTYPVEEVEEVGEYDDWTKPALVAELVARANITDEAKADIYEEKISEYSITKLIAMLEKQDQEAITEVWTPDTLRYPGLYGSDEVRSLEIEAMRRFMSMLADVVEDDYRLTDKQRSTFSKELKNLNKVADSQGISFVYPLLGDTAIMEYLVGINYRENVKVTLLQNHITDNVDVTEEEVLARYNQLLATQKSTYDANVQTFYDAVTAGDTNVLYYPNSNYYYVKHILIPFSDAQTNELNLYKEGEGKFAGDDAIKAFKEKLGKQVKGFEHRDGEDYGKPISIDAIYADIVRTMEAATSYKDKERAFDSLIYKYNTDPGIFGNELGYAVTAKFADGEEYDTTYMEEFSRAADELYRNGEVGAISAPAVTDYGVHVLYLSKIPTAGEIVGINDYLSYGERTTMFEIIEEEQRTEKINNEFYKWQNEKVGYYQTVAKIITVDKEVYANLLED